MIAQLKVLLRVKNLKLDQALRAMLVKRQQHEAAVAATARARAALAESEATYAAREDAIYTEILRMVVDQGEVDETRGRVVQLEKDHMALKDDVERALHVEARVESELDAAVARYNHAMRVRDKFAIITDDVKRELEAVQEAREEIEIEDLFSKRRKQAA